MLLHRKKKGEKLVKTALSQLNEDYNILFNISFRVKYHKSSIKCLIITPKRIYNVETIYDKGILALNDKDKLVFYDKFNRKKEERRLVSKLKKDEENIRTLLKKHLAMEKLPKIKNIVSYTELDCVFDEEDSPIPVVKYNQLMSYIRKQEKDNSSIKYSLDERRRLVRIIINQDEKFHFKRHS